MDLEYPFVLIGRHSGDNISIRILGRKYPEASDYWDGNWLVAVVVVAAGDFRGEVGAALRAEELSEFSRQLTALRRELDGAAELTSIEGWLNIAIRLDGVGHVRVKGQVRDRLDAGNELTFVVDGLDQSDLQDVIDSLDEVCAAFPVTGRR